MDQERLNELNVIAHQRRDSELMEALRYIVALQEQAREVPAMPTREQLAADIREWYEDGRRHYPDRWKHLADCVLQLLAQRQQPQQAVPLERHHARAVLEHYAGRNFSEDRHDVGNMRKALRHVFGNLCPSVPETNCGPCDRELERVTADRDTALRERDEARERVEELEAENLRLERLFQQSHGCHSSWVNAGIEARKRAERAEAALTAERDAHQKLRAAVGAHLNDVEFASQASGYVASENSVIALRRAFSLQPQPEPAPDAWQKFAEGIDSDIQRHFGKPAPQPVEPQVAELAAEIRADYARIKEEASAVGRELDAYARKVATPQVPASLADVVARVTALESCAHVFAKAIMTSMTGNREISVATYHAYEDACVLWIDRIVAAVQTIPFVLDGKEPG